MLYRICTQILLSLHRRPQNTPTIPETKQLRPPPPNPGRHSFSSTSQLHNPLPHRPLQRWLDTNCHCWNPSGFTDQLGQRSVKREPRGSARQADSVQLANHPKLFSPEQRSDHHRTRERPRRRRSGPYVQPSFRRIHLRRLPYGEIPPRTSKGKFMHGRLKIVRERGHR